MKRLFWVLFVLFSFVACSFASDVEKSDKRFFKSQEMFPFTTPIPSGYDAYGKQIVVFEETEGFRNVDVVTVKGQKLLTRMMGTVENSAYPAVIKISSGSGVFVEHERKKVLIMSKHQGVDLEELWKYIPYNTVAGVRYIEEEDIAIIYPVSQEVWKKYSAIGLFDNDERLDFYGETFVDIVGFPKQQNKKAVRVVPWTAPDAEKVWEISLVCDKNDFGGLSGGAIVVDGQLLTIVTGMSSFSSEEWWTGKLIGPNPKRFGRVVRKAIFDGFTAGQKVERVIRDIPVQFIDPQKNYYPVVGEMVKIVRVYPTFSKRHVGKTLQVIKVYKRKDGWVELRTFEKDYYDCEEKDKISTILCVCKPILE